MAAHHLVAGLHQVLRIEKGIAREQRVANGFGMRIERAVLG